jgi:peptidoglycan/LPS O-acetylase OafA/YrhL
MSANGRLKELDALRGLAALMVVVGHFVGAYFGTLPNLHDRKAVLVFLVLQAVSNGHAAVILFFLLSGFVLSMPSIHHRPQKYAVFITRRIFRIYVPYLAALFLAVLGSYFLHDHLALTEWANQTWSQPVQWPLVWQHVLFIGSYNWQEFNTAFWSLVIEMRVSLMFPLLCALVLRLPWRLSLLMSGLVACGTSVLSTFLPQGAPPPSTFYFTLHRADILSTLYFASLFIIGILMARHRSRLTQWAGGLTTGMSLAMFLGSMLLYIYGDLALACFCHVAFRGRPLVSSMVSAGGGDWPCAIGAAGIILLALGRKSFSEAMLSSFCQFFGKISYSVYLLHGTILFGLLHLYYGKIPTPLLLLIYLAGVVGCSTVFYKYVEEPSMEIGLKVSNRLKMPGAVKNPGTVAPVTPI